MVTLLWIAGMFVGCSIVFSLFELGVQLVVYRRVRTMLGDREDVFCAVDPVLLRFPIGTAHVTGEISSSSVEPLKQAAAKVGAMLKISGLAAGVFAVALVYGVLLLVAPSSSAPYWSLLFLPLSGFANIGERGLRADKRKLGEIEAFLNQLFVGGFTAASFAVVVLIFILRYFRVLP